MPPEPRHLAEFLRSKGGVRDEGGELIQIEAHERPGLVNRYGMTLDEAAHAAWEGGYFPEASRFAKIRLDAFTGLPQFRELPDGMQSELIHKTITGSREAARSLLMMRSPDIITQAIAAKTAAIRGNK